ncbi:MAG: DegT/DnrJ/EryC1/StrS family aminotransferase [Nitrospirae bacterium]|nr:DegT/DnrJ/EryC1/StrS family aminotransferase [Nitrospirota bacterium]
MIPIIKPTLIDFNEIKKEFREVWESGKVTVSKYTNLFEEEVKKTLGVRNVIAVSSCTSGLILAIKALELKGEVILPSFTFAATAHALVWNNITPVFCDSETGTYNIDASKIEPLITGKTSAIMPVYIFGVPPKIYELERIASKHHLKLIFDSAQGLGSKYKGKFAGGFGDVEVFSLSPTKVVSSIEGGLITTNNDKLAGKIRQMRDYGKSLDGEDMDFVGLSARISEFHSIIGLKNFMKVKQLIEKRSYLIRLYKNHLKDVRGISFQSVPEDCKSTGNYMVVFVDEKNALSTRNEIYEFLKENGIQTKKYFYPALHMQTAYMKYRKTYQGKLQVAERAADEGLALPLYSHMAEGDVQKICSKVKEVLSWRQKYSLMSVAQAKKIKEIEKENARLKRLAANLSFDKTILNEINQVALLKPEKGISGRQ